MEATTIQQAGTILFAVAVVHTFLVSRFERLAHRYPEGSIGENVFHFLGEVEAVFGMWAGVFIAFYSITLGVTIYDPADSQKIVGGSVHFLENLNFTEPAFVFVIMCMAGTRPVIYFAEKTIEGVAFLLPIGRKKSFYIATLIIGPLLGSFITEPAAMTVTALILKDAFFGKEMSRKFKYATLGLLFVNISIGGTLTHFAAPPVLMVAGKWGWGIEHMFTNFGWKAVIAVVINALVISAVFRKELVGKLAVEGREQGQAKIKPPWWIILTHLIFLGMVVYTAHHMVFFIGLFLFFLGFAAISMEFQDPLKLKESLLVGFFLAGLVVLGSQQTWWLQPLLAQLGDHALFFGATGLTAITDNAALTYLGSLVELSDSAKYYLVAGAVAGGGLTVIANAPNPAGFGILKSDFGENGISPLGLLIGALFPTAVSLVCFALLPSF